MSFVVLVSRVYPSGVGIMPHCEGLMWQFWCFECHEKALALSAGAFEISVREVSYGQNWKGCVEPVETQNPS